MSENLMMNYLRGFENLSGGRFFIMAAKGGMGVFHPSIPPTRLSTPRLTRINQRLILSRLDRAKAFLLKNSLAIRQAEKLIVIMMVSCMCAIPTVLAFI